MRGNLASSQFPAGSRLGQVSALHVFPSTPVAGPSAASRSPQKLVQDFLPQMVPAGTPTETTRALPGPRKVPRRNATKVQSQRESSAGVHTHPVGFLVLGDAPSAAQNRRHGSVRRNV